MTNDIVDTRGKVLKSQFKKRLEESAYKPMMGMVLCGACGKRWMSLFPVKLNFFGLECPVCKAKQTFVTIIPREYESNFINDTSATDATHE